MKLPIYMDYHATTPVDPRVLEAMNPYFTQHFGNAASRNHSFGWAAEAAVDNARAQVAALIGGDAKEIVFTSGATEAINLALKGSCAAGRTKVVTVATEHAAVLDSCEWLEQQGYEIVRLPVGPDGLVSLQDVRSAVDDRTALVAVMLVNNEIGVIQPIAGIAKIAHEAGALMLCDAVQGFGRMSISEGPDLIAACAHKIHGPKMVGALWMRDGLKLEPLVHGGGQERGLRSGTLSPMLCVGFGAAAALAAQRRDADRDHVGRLWSAGLEALGSGWEINGSTEQRYRGNLNIRREGLDAARLIADLRDIAFSLGSACASGSGRPSHVLRALGLTDRQARSSIRLGFGRYTSEDELVGACRRIAAAAEAQERFAA